MAFSGYFGTGRSTRSGAQTRTNESGPGATRIHNPFGEARWVSRLRENLTSGSDGEGLETGQMVPRQSFTRQKSISEQIDFFHLNMVSSSMVIKVDFDLTMSILANNLYRLLALELERYSHLSVQSLYDKFVLNGADIIIQEDMITVQLKKKRNLPLILEVMPKYSRQKYPWLNDKNVIFEGATYS